MDQLFGGGTRLTQHLPNRGDVRDAWGQTANEIWLAEERLLQAIHPDDREHLAGVWDRAHEEHEPYAIEYRLVLSDGEVRHNHEIGIPEFDESGRYLGHFGTTQDITERKQAENALLQGVLTCQQRLLDFSEIIKTETFGLVGSAQYRDYAEDIHVSGKHLLGLINDILDLSKIESGKDALREEEIEIPGIIRSSLRLVEQRAEQGGIKLELDFADQLPALRADERKLRQILVNLLSNAVKFTDAGGEVTLRAWCRMDSGYVFQIVDTGIGIAPEDIPKALSRFGEVDGDLNRQYEGAGLGLPLTKALVELHGRSLDLQSEVGVGTTVTVRFPAEGIVASLNHADSSLDVEAGAAS